MESMTQDRDETWSGETAPNYLAERAGEVAEQLRNARRQVASSRQEWEHWLSSAGDYAQQAQGHVTDSARWCGAQVRRHPWLAGVAAAGAITALALLLRRSR